MAIKAEYTEVDADGKVLFALHPADFEKVRAGYACPNCLEDFTDSNGIVAAFGKCPVCGHVVNPELDFKSLPGYWDSDPGEAFDDPGAPTLRRPRPLPKLDRSTEAALVETGWIPDPRTGKKKRAA